ncbi:hypothetical protein PO81_00005, partial [Vibrio parahaemolyticus]
ESENEISLAGIYRAYCSKFDLKNEILEWGLKIFKNNNVLKDLVEKEDIYNPIVVSSLVSKLENLENLELFKNLVGVIKENNKKSLTSVKFRLGFN